MNFIQIPFEILLPVSSVIGIIIGFASTEIISQLVAGLYLITSGSFKINDLIEVDGNTGLILEIGLNYTILQRFDGCIVRIPNKKLLDSKIKNYTINIPEELQKQQSSEPAALHISAPNPKSGVLASSRLKSVLGDLNEFISEPHITHYTFSLNVEFSIPSKMVCEKLDKICNQYREIFGYRLYYSILSLGWRSTIAFQVYCKNPCIIINNFDRLIQDIAK